MALDWFDRARRATDFVTRTLFDFFALEALLGDRSEGEKGLGITFRRTMLSVAVNERFSSPHALFFFYDQVRSGAVHGELPSNWRTGSTGSSFGTPDKLSTSTCCSRRSAA